MVGTSCYASDSMLLVEGTICHVGPGMLGPWR